jgi:cytochrome c oxidase subunit 2
MTAGPRHGRRILLLWLPASVAADLLIWFVLGPHLPPGDMASAAANQQSDIKVMAVLAAPVTLAVLIYFGYALTVWRQPAGDESDGPALHGNARVQVGWVAATSAIVLLLFVFGTVELVGAHGAGAGEGPSPVWKPGGAPLQVQVIGQQWKFTYRYPTYGGFETNKLVIPDDTTIAFHVTSLDVIHSFWAYQLGVKADANPAQDNVAYTTTSQLGTFTVRCSELCGLWHGAMYNNGSVVSPTAFQRWAKATEVILQPNTKLLPPFAYTYIPDANGADGGFYPDNVDPYSKVQTYGASPAVPAPKG